MIPGSFNQPFWSVTINAFPTKLALSVLLIHINLPRKNEYQCLYYRWATVCSTNLLAWCNIKTGAGLKQLAMKPQTWSCWTVMVPTGFKQLFILLTLFNFLHKHCAKETQLTADCIWLYVALNIIFMKVAQMPAQYLRWGKIIMKLSCVHAASTLLSIIVFLHTNKYSFKSQKFPSFDRLK